MATVSTEHLSRDRSSSVGIFLSFCLLIFVAVPPVCAVEGDDCAIAKTAIDMASQLRGLAVVKSVPCKLQSREEVEAYLIQTIRERITDVRIEHESIVYKLIGLIPQDYRYRDGLVALYTEQLGGYYDPYREYYAMARWLPRVMQMPIAVHELTHALQDQHFSLDRILDLKNLSSDELMARSALIEGDAMLVMLEHRFARRGGPPLAERESVAGFVAEYLAGVSLQAKSSNSPRALRAGLIFPYTSGLRFAHALLRDGGYDRVNKTYRNLPASTEEILHPEMYLAGKHTFRRFEFPESIKGVGRRSYSDRLGEFLISTLLSTWLDPGEAARASAGWNGDAITLYGSKDNGRHGAQWLTAWDTRDDAREFFDAVAKAYAERVGAPGVRTHTRVTFIDKRVGVIRISLNEATVQLDFGF